MAMEAQLDTTVVEVAKLRFSAPVKPGTRLSLQAELRSESHWRIRLAADGQEVLRGLFGFSAESGAPPGESASFGLGSGRSGTADVQALYAALPHADSMRLLEAVGDWDTESLLAATRSHRHKDHPLRLDGRLHGLAALEYAAQGCALHGVLAGKLAENRDAMNSTTRGTTVVATVQHLQLHGGDLDHSGPELRTMVRCVLRQSQSAAYQCTVTDGLGWRLEATLGLMLTPD